MKTQWLHEIEKMRLKLGLSLWPRTVAYEVWKVFITPHKYAVSEIENEMLSQAESFYVVHEGKKIRCWEWNNGASKKALLVHGWSAKGIQLRQFINPLIEEGYHVITFDHIGHGESDGTTATIFDFAAGIQEVIRAIGSVDIIVAHSLGASASALVMKQKHIANKLILVAPSSDIQAAIQQFLSKTKIPHAIFQIIKKEIERRYGVKMEEISLQNFIDDLQCDILFVHDKNDRHVPWQHSAAMSAIHSNSKLLITKGLGHIKVLYDREVIQNVVRFVQEKKKKATKWNQKPAIAAIS